MHQIIQVTPVTTVGNINDPCYHEKEKKDSFNGLYDPTSHCICGRAT